MLRELGERVRCHHGAANCPRATIQVFFAECSPSDAKNTAVELGVHGLALGNKFMVNNPSNVEKHDEHAFERLTIPILRHPVVTSEIHSHLQNSDSTVSLIYHHDYRQHTTSPVLIKPTENNLNLTRHLTRAFLRH